jgi:hypothetical protein
MTNKHTPGPWRLSGCLIRGQGRILARTHNHITQPVAEGEANARLIAAAPELLGALKQLRRETARMLDNMPYLFPANGRTEDMTDEQRSWRLVVAAMRKQASSAIDAAEQS